MNFERILFISSSSNICRQMIKEFVKKGSTALLHVRSKSSFKEIKESLGNCDPAKIIQLDPIEIDSYNFESWFKDVCTKYAPDSVIVATGKLGDLMSHSEAIEVNGIYPIKVFEYFVKYAERDKDQKYNMAFLNSILSEITWLNPSMYGYAKNLVSYYLGNVAIVHPNITVHNALLGPVDTNLIRNTEFSSYKLMTTSSKIAKYICYKLKSGSTKFYAPFIWNFMMYPLHFALEIPKIISLGLAIYLFYSCIKFALGI